MDRDRIGHHLLDQADVWLDEQGRAWPVWQLPPATAAELLDGLRSRSLHLLAAYTKQVTDYVQTARWFGEDVPADWEPDSAPFNDECILLQLEGGDRKKQIALSMTWLDAKPLVQVLERRAHGLDI